MSSYHIQKSRTQSWKTSIKIQKQMSNIRKTALIDWEGSWKRYKDFKYSEGRV